MSDFVGHTNAIYDPQWFHNVLCQKLDAFIRGEIKRLMVWMPPQHGKSEHVSRKLPAKILGDRPDAKIIASSYAAELIQGMNRDVQRTIESPEYAALYPDTTLNTKNIRTLSGTFLRNNDIFEVVGRRGQYRCAGVGGGISGFPADYAILDDPYKDYKEATSPTVRRAVWEWYTSVFLARTHVRSSILITTTRWHERDVCGELLEREGDQWTIVKFPALCVDPTASHECRGEGEALWPDKFPVELLQSRRALNPHQFEALYQQNPRPREGGMFQRGWFEIVGAAPADARRAIWWDKASTAGAGDWTVGVLMAAKDGIFYVEEVIRFRKSTHERNADIKAAARRNAEKYGNVVRIYGPQDPGSAGKDEAIAFKQMLAGFPVETMTETGSKEVRAQPFADQAQAGNIKIVRGEWNEEYFEELESFGSGAYDDQVDASSGVFNKLALAPQPTFMIRSL